MLLSNVETGLRFAIGTSVCAEGKVRVLMTQTYVDRPVTPENKLRRFEVEWAGDEPSEQVVAALT